jgi:hypothetical protein
MTSIAFLQGTSTAPERRAETDRRTGYPWSLDQVVFAVVVGAAFACAVLALVLPIYVWLD